MILNYGLQELTETAATLLEVAKGYRLVRFEGEIGAGKTTLIKELVRQLGSTDEVSSPSFAIVNEYQSPNGRICHFDFYRMKSESEAIDIGIFEYWDSGDLCLMEWTERVENLLDLPVLTIQIERSSENNRTLNIYDGKQ